MDQFFKGAQLIRFYLVQRQKPLRPPSGQFNRLHFLLRQPILNPILLDLPLAFLLGRVVASIDDEVVLAGHPSPPHVVLEDSL